MQIKFARYAHTLTFVPYLTPIIFLAVNCKLKNGCLDGTLYSSDLLQTLACFAVGKKFHPNTPDCQYLQYNPYPVNSMAAAMDSKAVKPQ
jgi:hypothetical protein